MLLKKYDLSPEQYEFMLRMQNGVCAICEKPPKAMRLAVDHDHGDGRVRGLLCFLCNKFLVGKHTVITARKVLAYLDTDFDGRLVKPE
jgi:recombination endonuclease VII